ncbi:uncharacterized protein LOC143601578 [Bidens hawaiensis]|uniref:uncharacterized protein LOC143601578 n=1 Tax=Bidens hawaiensis TaxID=980011 RepID=UPI00404ADFC8
MESTLDAQGLWEVVSGEALDERKNNMARVIIFQALPENVLMQVARTRDAQEIWESLRVRFLGADRVQQARLRSLKRDFSQLKMGEKESVREIVGKVTEHALQFDSLGSPMEEHEHVKKLLDSVPDRFIAIVATIEQWADLNTMVFEDCIARLKAFEEKNQRQGSNGRDQDRKNYARGRGSSGYDQWGHGRGRGRGSSRGRGRFNQNYDNRRDGHFAWECPRPPTKEENLNQAEAKPPTLMMASVEVDKEQVMLNEEKIHPICHANDSVGDLIWYLDNGASNHKTGCEAHLPT